MKKKTLLLSTLAGSMLVAGMAFPSVNASSNNIVVNEEQNIVVVQLTDGSSQLSKVEFENMVKDKYSAKGLSISPVLSGNTVATGSKVKIDNDKTLDVVVYGDINGDGLVDISDAQIITQRFLDGPEFNRLESIAGGIAGNDSSIDISDAQRLTDFMLNPEDYADSGFIDNTVLPEEVIEPTQQEQYNYSFTINGNNMINDTNSSTSKINITIPNGRAEEETTFKLYYVNSKGEDVEISASNLKIAKYADESGEIQVSFSSYINNFVASNKESKVTLKLKIANTDTDKVVATTEVAVNRIHPETVKVNAWREGTEHAKLQFEAKAGSDIVKVHYIISDNNTNASSVGDLMNTRYHPNLKTITVENNKFNNILEWDALENSTTSGKNYKIYFVVENAAGNRSTNVLTAVVPNDSNGKIEGKVTNLSVNDSLSATWSAPKEGAPTNGYIVTVYDESGKVVGENTTTSSSYSLGNIVKNAGKYSVTITSKGNTDGSSSSSEETEPVEFEVTQLAKVTGLKFVVDQTDSSKVSLKWDEYSEKTNTVFKSYTIKIYEYDSNKGEYKSSAKVTKTNISKDANEIKLDELPLTADVNTRYKAEIQAISSQGKVIASEATSTTKDYLKLSVALTSGDIADTKVALSYSEIATVEKLGEVTYDVEVWSEVESETSVKHYELANIRKNVTKDEDGNIVVDKLEPGTNYKFILVVHIDGDEAEGRSALSNQITTKKTLPSIDGLIVTKAMPATAEAGKGKIYVGASEIWIDGVKVTTENKSSFYDPDKLLVNDYIEKLVRSLKDNDTIVSLTEEKVTIKVANVATNDTARSINVGSTRILEIQGNIYEQYLRIGTTEAKEVILSGDNALFSIDYFNNSAPIKVSDGVKLVSKDTNAFKVTVLANAKATINEIDISSSGDLEISETLNTKHELKIKSAGNNTININNHSKKELEVTFMDEAAIGDFQLGKITVNSNAKITIKANEESTVGADISVTTENGDIDITDDKLTGSKNVIVSTNKNSDKITIKANTKLKAPIDMSSTEIEIMNYTVEQLKDLKENSKTIKGSSLTKSMLITCSSDEDYQAIVDYFNAFGSKLQAFGKAKVKVTKDSYSVEISIPAESEITLTDIEGLK